MIGPDGHPFEVQIRTWDMHKIAEFGIAAHWSYKEKGSKAAAEDSRIAWLRSLLDNSEGTSPQEFIDSLKVDLYPDEVYSFTPRGDVFSFPRGATILDFAYRVHTEVGHSCVGGRINGRWVPIKTEIVNGDIVEVSTSPQQRPHHDWLNIVVTTRARNKVRSWLKREEKARAVDVGRKLLERELRKGSFNLKKAFGTDELRRVGVSHGCAGEEDLLAAIGFGKVATGSVVADLFPDDSHAQEKVAPPPARGPGVARARRRSRSRATRTFWCTWPSAAARCPARRSWDTSLAARVLRFTRVPARTSRTCSTTRNARSRCGGRPPPAAGQRLRHESTST